MYIVAKLNDLDRQMSAHIVNIPSAWVNLELVQNSVFACLRLCRLVRRFVRFGDLLCFPNHLVWLIKCSCSVCRFACRSNGPFACICTQACISTCASVYIVRSFVNRVAALGYKL